MIDKEKSFYNDWGRYLVVEILKYDILFVFLFCFGFSLTQNLHPHSNSQQNIWTRESHRTLIKRTSVLAIGSLDSVVVYFLSSIKTWKRHTPFHSFYISFYTVIGTLSICKCVLFPESLPFLYRFRGNSFH